MTELARCPCGNIPDRLCIEDDLRPKWARVAGSCCNEWWIEFRNDYHEVGSDESMQRAVRAWNEAPRGLT